MNVTTANTCSQQVYAGKPQKQQEAQLPQRNSASAAHMEGG